MDAGGRCWRLVVLLACSLPGGCAVPENPALYSGFTFPSQSEELTQADFEEANEPTIGGMLQLAAGPWITNRWISSSMLQAAVNEHCECSVVLVMLDWTATKFRSAYNRQHMDFMRGQDVLLKRSLEEGRDINRVVSAVDYRTLLAPLMTVRRMVVNVQDFFSVLTITHGTRCFTLAVKEALARLVHACDRLSHSHHTLEMAIALDSTYAFRRGTSSLTVQLGPLWAHLENCRRFCEGLQRFRWVLHNIQEEQDMVNRAASESHMQDKTGGFSEGNFAMRTLNDKWHLDHGLVGSLIRLWPPNKGARRGVPTTVVDFGAGAGHYCRFLNQTGHISCLAFDGSSAAPEYTDGVVQTMLLDQPIDLGRSFDWVMCIEVAEHIPREYEATFLDNLRRHAREGLIISWSEHGGGGVHPNARPWGEVLELLSAAHFRHDEAATADIRTRISWLRGAVHVFRTTWPDAQGRLSPWAPPEPVR